MQFFCSWSLKFYTQLVSLGISVLYLLVQSCEEHVVLLHVVDPTFQHRSYRNYVSQPPLLLGCRLGPGCIIWHTYLRQIWKQDTGSVRWVKSTCSTGAGGGWGGKCWADVAAGHSGQLYAVHWVLFLELQLAACLSSSSEEIIALGSLLTSPFLLKCLRVESVVCNWDLSDTIPLPVPHHYERSEKSFLLLISHTHTRICIYIFQFWVSHDIF